MHIVWISGHFRPRDAPRPRAHVSVPSGRADPNERRWSLRTVRGNPPFDRIERSSPPVDSTASRNGYPPR